MRGLIPSAKLFVKRNSSTILTVIGAAGVIATGVVTAKCTIKALDLLAEAEDLKQDDLTEMEVVKTVAPAYIPAVLTGAATITCIFGANVLNKRQQAAIMSAYALLDRTYKDYKNRVIELYGEESQDKIKEAIARGRFVKDTALDDDERPLWFDMYSMQYFHATEEEVEEAERVFTQCVETGYACINDFYQLVGADPIEHGNDFGWFEYTRDIKFTHTFTRMDDGMECTIIDISSPGLY